MAITGWCNVIDWKKSCSFRVSLSCRYFDWCSLGSARQISLLQYQHPQKFSGDTNNINGSSPAVAENTNSQRWIARWSSAKTYGYTYGFYGKFVWVWCTVPLTLILPVLQCVFLHVCHNSSTSYFNGNEWISCSASLCSAPLVSCHA